MKITFISDTHNKHKQVTATLPGGDLLIHAGDLSSMGYKHEIQQFLKWFNGLDNYTHKIFIAGNHDWGFQDNLKVLDEDSGTSVKVYGSPWQPEFYNWAFNLPRMGSELEQKWNDIPMDIDILVTHGPAWGHLDTVKFNPTFNLGCELLAEKIKTVKPKIHVCGHIDTGYGYKFIDGTHFINAALLDEQYTFTQKPITADWNPDTNEMEFI